MLVLPMYKMSTTSVIKKKKKRDTEEVVGDDVVDVLAGVSWQ